MKIQESFLRKIVREEIKNLLNEEAPEIENLELRSEEGCIEEYDLDQQGIKVYFTLPESYGEITLARSLIHARDIVRNFFVKDKLSTSSVIHAGIVFSDGTTLEPVSFITNNQTINPRETIVLLIKGTTAEQEDKIRKKAQELIQFHEKANTQDRYNRLGILGKIPFIGSMLMDIVPRQVNTFYCSQLIAYMLGYVGVVSLKELEQSQTLEESEQLEDEVYRKDALSPSELYDLIKGRADLLSTKCKQEQPEQQESFEDLMNL
jgi:hypothetical protein